MKDTDIIEEKFGEIELKLLKAKVLKEVEEILEQGLNKNEDFLYPIINLSNQSERLATMDLLVKGEFMGYKYEICTNGMYPVVYVNCRVYSHVDKEKCEELPVHGGCTFIGNRVSADDIWVGWDYGHYGDLIFDPHRIYPPYVKTISQNGKKWTVTEVMHDVVKAILHIEETS